MNQLKPINCPLCNAATEVKSGKRDSGYYITLNCAKCDVKLEKILHQSDVSAAGDLIAYLFGIRQEMIVQWNTRIKN